MTNDMARTRSVESAKSGLDVIDIRGDTAVVTVRHETIRTVEDAAGSHGAGKVVSSIKKRGFAPGTAGGFAGWKKWSSSICAGTE